MLKLAQFTGSVTQTENIQLGTNDLGLVKVAPTVTFINILTMILPVIVIGVYVVFWFMALVGALTRKDLKENRLLWVIILLIGGPIGMIIYFFIENRKKLAWTSLILGILLVLFMFLLPIIMFASNLN